MDVWLGTEYRGPCPSLSSLSIYKHPLLASPLTRKRNDPRALAMILIVEYTLSRLHLTDSLEADVLALKALSSLMARARLFQLLNHHSTRHYIGLRKKATSHNLNAKFQSSLFGAASFVQVRADSTWVGHPIFNSNVRSVLGASAQLRISSHWQRCVKYPEASSHIEQQSNTFSVSVPSLERKSQPWNPLKA